MKKTLAFILSIFLVITLFAGCGKKDSAEENKDIGTPAQQETQEEQNGQEQQVDEETDKFPLTVKDDKGSEMTIEKKPESIVSLTLGTDEILLSLVDISKIKALSTFASERGLSNVVEVAEQVPVKLVGSETEKIISLQPDIVFVADWTNEDVVQQLRDANIVVYAYKTPSTIDGMKDLIRTIAGIVGESKKGEEIIAGMDEKLKYIESKLASLKEEDKLTVICCDSYFYAHGKNTTFDDIATRAGVINLISEIGIEGWVEFSKEKIVELDPDVIILPSWSFEGFNAEEFANDIRNDKSLVNVKAVKNNRVFMLPDSHMLAISQYIAFAVEDLAKAVYPELFK
ncbi:MAG TPA: ABC transporter substrate-binding protein [Clostridiaceae bacterium]|nr:ABC transporter substrate-binding protein [Clostridiaceae bacterium]